MVALRHFLRGLRLLDLLLQLLVFDLGDPLAAGDAVAELHVDLLEPARRARHDRDGGIANQVADDGELLLDRVATRQRATSTVIGPAEPAASAADRRRRAARRAACAGPPARPLAAC